MLAGSQVDRSCYFVLFTAGSPYPAITFGVDLVLNGLGVILIIRLGLLAEAAAFVFQFCLLENFPLTTQGLPGTRAPVSPGFC